MGHSADWFNETVRRDLWPLLHPGLELVGGYAIGVCPPEQRAATIPLPIEEVEKILHELGFIRNNIACLKQTESGEWSAGSWVWRESEHQWLPDRLAEMQLHVTLFENLQDNSHLTTAVKAGARTVAYAHWEDNYWRAPFDHLQSAHLSAEEGRKRFQGMLREEEVAFYLPRWG